MKNLTTALLLFLAPLLTFAQDSICIELNEAFQHLPEDFEPIKGEVSFLGEQGSEYNKWVNYYSEVEFSFADSTRISTRQISGMKRPVMIAYPHTGRKKNDNMELFNHYYNKVKGCLSASECCVWKERAFQNPSNSNALLFKVFQVLNASDMGMKDARVMISWYKTKETKNYTTCLVLYNDN